MNATVVKPEPNKPHVLTAPIGHHCARVNIGIGVPNSKTPRSTNLYLHAASGVDDGAFYPAESFNVYGYENIVALRDLLNEAIKLANTGINPEPVADAIQQAQAVKV